MRIESILYFSIILVLVFTHACSPKLERHILTNLKEVPELESNTLKVRKSRICNDPNHYIPYPSKLHEFPERLIRVNIHFVNSSEGDQNYMGEEAYKFAQGLIYNANYRLSLNEKMRLPEGNSTPALEPYYRYELTPSEYDSIGVHFHHDDELYYFINKGKKRNNYKRAVINKYAVAMDSVLNIFIMPHHPDSLNSPTYNIPVTGIALGNAVKLAVVYDSILPFSSYGTLLNHEIGHVMGLQHSWNLNDGCDDTPKHGNCWGQTEYPPCNVLTSNNMMDYNNSQMAISPCQIGIVHRNMSKEKSIQRNLLKKTWCNYDADKTIVIEQDVVWEGAKDLQGDIIIKKGGSLEIKCRISMAEQSKIVVEHDGSLILNNAKIHNDCGKAWKGIEYFQKEGDEVPIKKIGTVILSDVVARD